MSDATRRRAVFALLLVVSTLAAPGCDRAPAREERPAPVSHAGPPAARCEPPPGAPSPATRPGVGAAAGPFVTFTDVAKESGLAAHIQHAGNLGEQNWLLETIGGGAIVLDYDADGRMDLLLVDGDGIDIEGNPVGEPGARTRLWHNEGGMRFTDVTQKAGIDLTGYCIGGAAADYDGDGFPDFAVAGYGILRVFRNQGDGTFLDVSREAGMPLVAHDTFSTCAWGDLDGDGHLDLFVTAYGDQYAKIRELADGKLSPRSCVWRGHPVYCGPSGLKHGANRVFFQLPDHTFEDRTKSNLESAASYSFQAVMSDLDGDGHLDVYVANDTEANHLLMNDGRGRLVDRAVEAGVAADISFTLQSSMGVDVADYDHDGAMDVFVTNFAHEHNTLYRNRTRRPGRPFFEDVSSKVRISLVPSGTVAWGTKLADFDGDGELDVLVACGHIYTWDEIDTKGRIGHRQRLQLLRGAGGPVRRFDDVSAAGGAVFHEARLWRGAAFADFDDDGDWDVVVTALRDVPALLRNDGGERSNWIRFDLRGRAGSGTPAGARVEVRLDAETTLYGEVHCGSSFCGSDDPRLLFGVGGVRVIPRVVVRWPGGGRSELTDVATRRTVVVREEPR